MRPVFAQPGYTEADVHALLASRRFAFADCFTVRSLDGMVLRYTSVQQNVLVIPVDDPETDVKVSFTSKTVKVSGIKLTIGIGVEVDEQSLKFDYDKDQLYLGSPFAAAITKGRFDGATIRRDRYFCHKPGSPWIGGTPLFVGKLSTADSVGRSSATIKVKSDLVLLNINMPRKLFQPSCTRTLFDPDCKLHREDFQVAGTMAAGSTSAVIHWSGANEGFRYGVIHVEDSEGVTLIRTIKAVDVGAQTLTLAAPLDFTPVTGTNFYAYPGCIRSYARCGDFNNRANFQAFEFVPKPETAY